MLQYESELEISRILVEWYETYKRELPWRETRDPYIIWISEIILQQTRVVQGLEYFLRFTERFPDVASLAAAEEDEVLKYWQGLGYYSRARNLHAAAKSIMERFNGVFPENYAYDPDPASGQSGGSRLCAHRRPTRETDERSGGDVQDPVSFYCLSHTAEGPDPESGADQLS